MSETVMLNERQALLLDLQEFYAIEADLLDDRRFSDWLDLLTDDMRYWMPLVRNVKFGEEKRLYSREQEDSAWMDEGKSTLRQRVEQLNTGIHWAEEPASRTSHIVTNLRILSVSEDGTEVATRCRLLFYRNRLQDEVDILVGKRNDTLRRVDGEWRICRREIILDQNVLLAKNLTVPL